MRLIAALFCILTTVSCTWVKDDDDDCPYGFWLNLHYTYNILDVEAAPEYVHDAKVFVYDTAGVYVTHIDVSQALLTANGHRVRVEGLKEGDYQFVVWSGIGNSQYAVSGDMQTLDDFRLSLAGQQTIYNSQLPDLFYGSQPLVHFDNDEAYASHDVYMMKNTNQLACLVVPLDEEAEMRPEDYTMKVVTPNGTMDARNRLVALDKMITYGPFAQDTATVDDIDYGRLHGMKFAINTLRLMENTECRVVLEKNTGEAIFSVSLPEYIGMIGSLYTNLGQQLTVQEYLDRQDFYTIVFFLSGDNLNQLFQLQVNNWKLRAYNHIKL